MDQQTLCTYIDHYLSNCQYQKGLNAKTIKAYRIDLQQFSVFMKDYDCNKESIQSYIASLYPKYKFKSIKRKIASLKAFFSYLEFEELISANPFNKIQIKLHEPFLLPRTIPFTTIGRILQCAYQQKQLLEHSTYQFHAVLRDVAVLELLFATGIRVSELCSLRPSDIDLQVGTVRIYGKGAKERIVQIGNAEVLSAVTAYYQAFASQITQSDCFFVNRLGTQLSDQSVRFMIRKYAALAGVEQHITPHMFRHSFATLLLEEDVDIRYIQQLLGHSSITTTQIYTHVTSKKQRDILTAKHPRNKIYI